METQFSERAEVERLRVRKPRRASKKNIVRTLVSAKAHFTSFGVDAKSPIRTHASLDNRHRMALSYLVNERTKFGEVLEKCVRGRRREVGRPLAGGNSEVGPSGRAEPYSNLPCCLLNLFRHIDALPPFGHGLAVSGNG